MESLKSGQGTLVFLPLCRSALCQSVASSLSYVTPNLGSMHEPTSRRETIYPQGGSDNGSGNDKN